MNFEQLVNELLLDLFEYLPSVDLLRAFSHLNRRFDQLLTLHFRHHGLDLQSIRKRDFDFICKENRSLLVNHVTALRFSDDDATPDQISRFFSHSLSLRQLAQLTSMTLAHVSSFEPIEQLIRQLDRHSPLTVIQFVDCHMKLNRKKFQAVLNRLWRLPQLTRCHLDFTFQSSVEFCLPTVRSPSIQRLSIDQFLLGHEDLIRLFRCAPNLRHLKARVEELPAESQFPSQIPAISSAELSIDHVTDGTLNLFRKLPHLTHLTIRIGRPYLTGDQWKDFILEHLPKLRVFRFWMFFSVNNEAEKSKFIDSFRTRFWLDRQWFVRLHWQPNRDMIRMFFHTLPYPFDMYSHVFDDSTLHIETTCPDGDRDCSYTRVTRLLNYRPPPNDARSSRFRFPNVRHLETTLPLTERFWSAFARFEWLTSVLVSSDLETNADLARSQLQELINRAPRLRVLSIAHWDSSSIQRLLLPLTSRSIRQLDLLSEHYLKRDRCFNREQCLVLLRSPLAQQCEVLRIVVNDRSSVERLSSGLPNLRGMKALIELAQEQSSGPTEEDFIALLMSSFSRTITEHPPGTAVTRLWIR